MLNHCFLKKVQRYAEKQRRYHTIIKSSTYVSFESSSTFEPRQPISNIYIYLYVSDQSVFIGSESDTSEVCARNTV